MDERGSARRNELASRLDYGPDGNMIAVMLTGKGDRATPPVVPLKPYHPGPDSLMKNNLCLNRRPHPILRSCWSWLVFLSLTLTLTSAWAQNLPDALDNALVWSSGGPAPWYGETSYTHDGTDAATSGGISDNQESWIETSVAGPGLVGFWWKVSSETNFDYLRYIVDGVTNAAISGEVDWVQRTNYLADGPHTLRWSFSKDKAFAYGLDRGFLDQVSFITPAAVITSQPQGVHQRQGSTVALNVGVTGDFLTYQWRREGSSLAGATQASLTLTNALAAQSGGYDVVITNIHNAVTSQVAVVDIYVALPMPTRSTNLGLVLGWGNNSYGQLNPPADLTNAVAVAGGDGFSVALRSDGTVVAWGLGGACYTCVPAGLSNVIAIALGAGHTLALREDGTVVAWGSGGLCQTCVPVGLSNVVAIAAGFDHSMALRDDSTTVAWGGNQYGQLNVISNLNDTVAIAAGDQFSLALRKNGSVVGWGRNDFGQVSGATNFANLTSISASGIGYGAVALKNDGGVVAWGMAGSGETNVPAGLSSVASVYGANGFNAALKNDGNMVAWGLSPSIPLSLNNIVGLATGNAFLIAVVSIPLVVPADVTTPDGGNAVFNVVAQGPGAFTYQWYFNGLTLPGATNASVTLSNLTLSKAGNYSVRVWSDQRQALSRPAKLTVTPRNDSFAQRIVASGGGGKFLSNNTTASSEAGEPNHANAFGNRSIWYQWTAPVTGSVTVDTIGSTFDTVVAVYTGDNFSNLVLQGGDDDGANFNRNSLLTLNCTAGVTYLIAVDGFLGATGGMILNVTPVLSIPSSNLAVGGQFNLAIFAPGGRKIALETSPDLHIWTPVSTNVAPADGMLRINQPVNGMGARLYRAHQISP